MRSRWYPGTLVHARTRPVHHAFRYPVSLFAFDLDELPQLDADLRLFGHNRRAVFSLRDADYLGDVDGSLRAKLERRMRERGIGELPTRIVLVTTPRTLGHAFNPISFFYCYDDTDTLRHVVVEVNNTFGEGHLYFLGADGEAVRVEHPKEFHVSPFNDMRGDYDFDLTPLGDEFSARIRLRRDDETVFSARLTARAHELTAATVRRAALTYPLNSLLTLPRILWQAFKLNYLRRMPFHTKPEPSSDSTYAATYPAYLSEFEAPNWLRPPAGRGAATSEEAP